MEGKRPTITDVAQRAGVSKATVSAVLNDSGPVKDATRERVLAVIRELNYRPSGLARRAGGKKLKSIGLLIKEIDNPYYSEIIASAREEAAAHGYSLLASSSEGDRDAERRLVELLRAKDVAGIIITPVFDEDTDLAHIFELKRRTFPFVMLEAVRGVQASLVDIDNVAATRRAVRYLIDEGHTRIVHLAGPGYSMHTEERIAGVRAAFAETSLVFSEEMIVPAGAHAEDGYRAGLAYFRRTPPEEWPTAVICYNDLVAFGLVRALGELRIAVPDAVSVVGYDDIELLQYLPVPLTSLHVPKREMGKVATRLLIRHIEAKEPLPPQKIYLEAELVVRASTRSLRAGDARRAEARPRPDGAALG